TRDDVQALRAQMAQQQEQLLRLTGLLDQMLRAREPAAEAPAAAAKAEPTPARQEKAGFFALAAGLDQGAAEWGQVRQLLARVRRISPEEQRGRPELTRVVDQ